jgi:hypothetical protein
MIKHVVLFKFKSEVELPEKKQKLENIKVLLEQLKESIDCLSFIEVGLNSNPAEAYDLALITEFKTWDDLKAYVVHPEHQKVAAVIRAILDQRACVDYEF